MLISYNTYILLDIRKRASCVMGTYSDCKGNTPNTCVHIQ